MENLKKNPCHLMQRNHTSKPTFNGLTFPSFPSFPTFPRGNQKLNERLRKFPFHFIENVMKYK